MVERVADGPEPKLWDDRAMDVTPEEAALEKVRTAESWMRNSKLQLQKAVADALAAGVPATRIAAELGVSRSRVYQIKDGK